LPDCSSHQPENWQNSFERIAALNLRGICKVEPEVLHIFLESFPDQTPVQIFTRQIRSVVSMALNDIFAARPGDAVTHPVLLNVRVAWVHTFLFQLCSDFRLDLVITDENALSLP